MQKWDYKVFSDENMEYAITAGEDLRSPKIEKILQEAGEEGWDLVSVVPAGRYHRYFLKRPQAE